MDPPDLESFWRRYCGHGGLVVLFASAAAQPDPLAAIPAGIFENPLFSLVAPGRDIRREFQQARRLQDPRMSLLKKAYSKGWEDFPHSEKAIFVIPRLKSMDFFTYGRKDFETLFEVAPVCFFESPADTGLLLAANEKFSSVLAEAMAEVRACHWGGNTERMS
ncbi:MAG: hypothetical protein NZR01_04555 [Bryobacteraceae bacterium]|nr:hypothetical protein [Bryobacteraceae bacterium]